MPRQGAARPADGLKLALRLAAQPQAAPADLDKLPCESRIEDGAVDRRHEALGTEFTDPVFLPLARTAAPRLANQPRAIIAGTGTGFGIGQRRRDLQASPKPNLSPAIAGDPLLKRGLKRVEHQIVQHHSDTRASIVSKAASSNPFTPVDHCRNPPTMPSLIRRPISIGILPCDPARSGCVHAARLPRLSSLVDIVGCGLGLSEIAVSGRGVGASIGRLNSAVSRLLQRIGQTRGIVVERPDPGMVRFLDMPAVCG